MPSFTETVGVYQLTANVSRHARGQLLYYGPTMYMLQNGADLCQQGSEVEGVLS